MDGGDQPGPIVVEIDELASIRRLCDSAERVEDGGKHFILMRGLRFLVQGKPTVCDALLCLDYPNPTYPTKLYFAREIPGPTLNWHVQDNFLGVHWWSWSWKNVSSDHWIAEILAAHLGAFQ